MTRIINLILIVALLAVFSQCKNTQIPLIYPNEDFQEFNQKFHADSSFQMSRINFPIEGYKQHGDKIEKWNPENWHMHKTPVGETPEDKYKVDVKQQEDLVIEKVWIEGTEFYVERRFKKIKGKWYLIYFKDGK